MKKITQILILLVFCLSCQKDPGTNSIDKYPVIGVGLMYDISGVKSFVTKTTGLNLFKITESDELVEEKFLDISGQAIFDTTKSYVTDVYNLNHDFIVFEGSLISETDQVKHNAVLYSRLESNFREFPDDIDLDLSWHFSLCNDFQKDNSNGVFYYNRVFPKNISRLSFSKLTSKDILPQSFDNIEFLTTGSGDCMYRTDPTQDVFSVVFSGGGSSDFEISIPIPTKFLYDGMENDNKTNLGFWQGPDNEVYLLTGWMKSAPSGGEELFEVLDIYRISFSSKQINYEQVVSTEDPELIEYISIDTDDQYKTFRGDVVYFVNKSSKGFLGIIGWAFNYKTGDLVELSLPYRRDIISFSHSDNYMFLGLDDDIIRISYENFSYTSLLSGRPDSYFISRLGASPQDDVYFEAIRSSDSKRVIGHIDAGGTFSYIDESLKGEVSEFIRVN